MVEEGLVIKVTMEEVLVQVAGLVTLVTMVEVEVLVIVPEIIVIANKVFVRFGHKRLISCGLFMSLLLDEYSLTKW